MNLFGKKEQVEQVTQVSGQKAEDLLLNASHRSVLTNKPLLAIVYIAGEDRKPMPVEFKIEPKNAKKIEEEAARLNSEKNAKTELANTLDLDIPLTSEGIAREAKSGELSVVSFYRFLRTY